MKINVHFVENDAKWAVSADPQTTVGEMKQVILSSIKGNHEKVLFFCNDNLLDNNEKTLEECAINENSTIICKFMKDAKTEMDKNNDYYEKENENSTISGFGENINDENIDEETDNEYNDPPSFIDSVNFLKNMGFQENQVIYVLRNNNYNLNTCIDLLRVDTKDPSIRRIKEETEDSKSDDSDEEDQSNVWTEEDDELMFRKFIKHGNNWKQIQMYFPDKTVDNCKQHWANVVRPRVIGEQPNEPSAYGPIAAKKRWSEADDEVLYAVWQVFGCDWDRISNHIPGKTPEQIREHWVTDLQPLLLAENRLTPEMIRKRNRYEDIGKLNPVSHELELGKENENTTNEDMELINKLKNEWTKEEMEKLLDLVLEKKNINIIIRTFNDRHTEDDVKYEVSKIEAEEQRIEEEKRKEAENNNNPFSVRYFPPLEVLKSEKRSQNSPIARVIKQVKQIQEKHQQQEKKKEEKEKKVKKVKKEDMNNEKEEHKEKIHRHSHHSNKEKGKINENEKKQESKDKRKDRKSKSSSTKDNKTSKDKEAKPEKKHIRNRRTKEQIREDIKQKTAPATFSWQKQNKPTELKDIKPWTDDETNLLKDLMKEYNKKWGVIAIYFENSHDLEDIMNHCKVLEQKEQENQNNNETKNDSSHESNEYDSEEESSSESSSDDSDDETSTSDSTTTDDQQQDERRLMSGKGGRAFRWTDKEDEKLLKLVDKYGSNWAKIQKKMPSRTVHSLSSRWFNDILYRLSSDSAVALREKYPKLFPASSKKGSRRNVSQPKKNPQVEFTEEEDKLIVQKAIELGPVWKSVAEFLPSKTTKQVYVRWNSVLQYRISSDDFHKIYPNRIQKKPKSTKRNYSFLSDEKSDGSSSAWNETDSDDDSTNSTTYSSSSDSDTDTTTTDDTTYASADDISSSSTDESGDSNEENADDEENPNTSRFSHNEDERILKVLRKKGYNWLKLKKVLKNRKLTTIQKHIKTISKTKLTDREVKEFQNNTRKPPESGRWTVYERKLLWMLIKEQGYRWEDYSRLFIPYKTASELKSYFENHIKPYLDDKQEQSIQRFAQSFRIGKHIMWTPEEDKLLEEKIKEYGTNWAKIYPFFPDRGDSSIQNHWSSLKRVANGADIIKTDSANIHWTEDEDHLLAMLKVKNTPHREIYQRFPDRTRNSIASRWARIKSRPDILQILKENPNGSNISSTDSYSTSNLNTSSSSGSSDTETNTDTTHIADINSLT